MFLSRVVVHVRSVPANSSTRSPALGSRIDLDKVQTMMQSMGSKLSPGAQQLMNMVRFQQQVSTGGFLSAPVKNSQAVPLTRPRGDVTFSRDSDVGASLVCSHKSTPGDLPSHTVSGLQSSPFWAPVVGLGGAPLAASR